MTTEKSHLKNLLTGKGGLDSRQLELIFKKYSPKIVFHLAAQAGVRYSISNPRIYIESNLLIMYYPKY